MLTVYDPDVSNRPSILKVMHLGRPQSAKIVKASPWDQVAKPKPHGLQTSPMSLVTTHDIRGGPVVKLNSPCKGERGVRTAFPHGTTNKAATAIVAYAPPQTKKDTQLYVDRRVRGIRTPRNPTGETMQKQERLTIRPGHGRPAAQHSLRIPYPPADNVNYDSYWPDGRPKCKSHPHRQYTADNVQLHHDPTWKEQSCRPLNSPQSKEVRTYFLMDTKTTQKRIRPVSLGQAMHTPYGNEGNRDPNLAQRRCRHYDTSGLLTFQS